MTDHDETVEHGGTHDLTDLGQRLLVLAAGSTARRASRTVVGVGQLRHTLIALLDGAALAEHESPGAATLHTLQGTGVLTTADREIVVPAGSLAQIPDERHGLRAEGDTVVLLTVSLPPEDQQPVG